MLKDSYPESALHKDVNGRRIEIPQSTRILKVNHCLMVHNVHFKLVLSISNKVISESLTFLLSLKCNRNIETNTTCQR